MRSPKRNFELLLAMAAMLLAPLSYAADAPSQEYKVKAAFIYNFAKFIEWPSGTFATDDSTFIIAVVGSDPFNGALEQLAAGKKVGTHPVEIRHFDSAESIGGCEILFVAENDDDLQSKICAKVSDRAVLTVGESEQFDENGGAVRFFTQNDKVRFEISPDATDRAKLKVSSKLLKLARIFKR